MASASASLATALSPTPIQDNSESLRIPSYTPVLVCVAVLGLGVLTLLLAVATVKLHRFLVTWKQKVRSPRTHRAREPQLSSLSERTWADELVLEGEESVSISSEDWVVTRTLLVPADVHDNSLIVVKQDEVSCDEARTEPPLQEPQLDIVDVIKSEASVFTSAILNQPSSSGSDFSSLSANSGWENGAVELTATPYTLTLFSVQTSETDEH